MISASLVVADCPRSRQDDAALPIQVSVGIDTITQPMEGRLEREQDETDDGREHQDNTA